MSIKDNHQLEKVENKEDVMQILKKRAIQLSEKFISEDESENQFEVIQFKIAEETYALENQYVSEVYNAYDITPIPNVPDFVTGVINVRGEIVSVIDIKKFFNLPQKGVANLNKVILLQSSEMKFGILVDEIDGTKNILKRNVQESIPTFDEMQLKYFTGVTEDGIIILDAARILQDNSLIIDDKLSS